MTIAYVSILTINKIFWKFYKLWLMSWKAYPRSRKISCPPVSKHQSLARFSFVATCRKKNIITSSVPESIKQFLKPGELTVEKRWLCLSSNDLTDSKKEIKFTKVEAVVIFQLAPCMIIKGNRIKDNGKINCSPDLL